VPPELSLADYQQVFADHLRSPTTNPLPEGVPAERMQVYEDLIFNNFESFLLSCFPISRELLGAIKWQQITKQCFAEIESRSPLFREISAIFLEWFQPKAESLVPEYPWLWEFMHYEWIELCAEIDPSSLNVIHSDLPVLNPTLQTAYYEWPVHQISVEFQPETPSPHCVAVFRNDDDEIEFVEINLMTMQLLEKLQNCENSIEQLAEKWSEALNWQNSVPLIHYINEIISAMQEQGVIISAEN
jgi:uncharacterized protein